MDIHVQGQGHENKSERQHELTRVYTIFESMQESMTVHESYMAIKSEFEFQSTVIKI